MKQKFIVSILCAMLLLTSCGTKLNDVKPESSSSMEVSSSSQAESSKEESKSEETSSKPVIKDKQGNEIPPEALDLIKFNTYVGMNNYMTRIINNLSSYYTYIANEDEFKIIENLYTSGDYAYRLGVSALNSDIIEDALLLAGTEPSYGALDELTLKIAEPMKNLMDTFMNMSRCYDFSDNQYEKAKEFHKTIRENIDVFTELVYPYMDGVTKMADARKEKEEKQLLEDGKIIGYNASHIITVAKQLLNECYNQKVYDHNIVELDLTKVSPIYEELKKTIEAYNTAMKDNDQLIKESVGSDMYHGLQNKLLQAVEWMIKQVESKTPIQDPGRAYLGGIIHIEEVLSDCIKAYNDFIS